MGHVGRRPLQQVLHEQPLGLDSPLHLCLDLLEHSPFGEIPVNYPDVVVLVAIVHLHLDQVVSSRRETTVNHLQVVVVFAAILFRLAYHSLLDLQLRHPDNHHQ